MKLLSIVISMLLFSSALVHAQDQTGVPAKITAANDKEFPAFIQNMEGDTLVFQLFKRPSNMNVPARYIKKVEFVGPFDTASADQLFNDGDYQGMIDKMTSELQPSIDAYWPLMSFQNNYQELFTKLMKAYLRIGDADSARKGSAFLLKNPDAAVHGQAGSINLLSALDQNDIAAAEAMLPEIKSSPGKLYLGACISRAKKEYAQAFLQITDLIEKYPNDLSWMPQAELLSAHLYLDTGLTNSAIQTSRQVMKMYAGTDVVNDAKKLNEDTILAKQKAEEEAAARAEAEAAERAAVRAKAIERARGYGFGALKDEGSDTNVVENAQELPEPSPEVTDEGSTDDSP